MKDLTSACNCLNRIDDKLREKNLKLVGYVLIFPGLVPIPEIATAWVDRKKAPKGQKNNPPPMMASHCPFCGVKLNLPKEGQESRMARPERRQSKTSKPQDTDTSNNHEA